MEKVIDIGVNFLNDQISKHKREILDNASENGVEKIIGICNNLSDIKEYQILKLMEKNVYSTVGCHPHNADAYCKDIFKSSQIIRDELDNDFKTVAIGECGLDFNRMFSSESNQLDCFASQLGIAQEYNMPLYIHERDAFEDVYNYLKETGLGEKAVIHCFTGNKEHLKKYLDIGCFIGITGWIADEKRGAELRDAISYLPNDRFMIETDAPYLYPKSGVTINNVIMGEKGRKINEPANVIYVAKKIAEIKNMDTDEVKRQSYKNTTDFFKI